MDYTRDRDHEVITQTIKASKAKLRCLKCFKYSVIVIVLSTVLSIMNLILVAIASGIDSVPMTTRILNITAIGCLSIATFLNTTAIPKIKKFIKRHLAQLGEYVRTGDSLTLFKEGVEGTDCAESSLIKQKK